MHVKATGAGEGIGSAPVHSTDSASRSASKVAANKFVLVANEVCDTNERASSSSRASTGRCSVRGRRWRAGLVMTASGVKICDRWEIDAAASQVTARLKDELGGYIRE